jgi:hypothetical protein
MTDLCFDVEPIMHPRYLLVIAVALGLGACFTPRDFIECADQTSCGLAVGGQCLVNAATGHQFCAYPDTACPEGFRWSDYDVEDTISGTPAPRLRRPRLHAARHLLHRHRLHLHPARRHGDHLRPRPRRRWRRGRPTPRRWHRWRPAELHQPRLLAGQRVLQRVRLRLHAAGGGAENFLFTLGPVSATPVSGHPRHSVRHI